MFRLPFALLVLSFSLVVQSKYHWKGLSFDKKNFLCYYYETLCENYLDEIDCGSNSTTDRIVEGCPNFPEEPNNIATFVGKCTCLNPIATDAASARITNQIISNRIGPEMSWMLEPWSSGPPYDLQKSYTIVCNELLNRLGCPAGNKLVVATTNSFKCECGTMKTASTAVSNLIVDQLNKQRLVAMPIFEDPVYLSTALSIAMVLVLGKLGAIVACYFKLPAILGYLLVGLGIQNFLNPMILKGPGFPYPSVNSEMKSVALTLVLMRAGLSVEVNDIVKNAVPTLCMAIIPYICEFFAFTYVGVKLFGWNDIEMGLFGSMMAALGPSVVIPPMLQLLSNTKKDYGYIPKQVLLSTPLEAVIAVVLFSIFSILNQSTTDPLYPWVKILPLYANCLLIPCNILFSIAMGIIIGFFVSKYMNYRVHLKNDFVWAVINKNLQMGSSTADLVFVLLVSCYTMMTLCTKQYIQQSSGVLVVFTCCVMVSQLTNADVTKDLAVSLKGIWVFAEVFLFTFVGTNLSLDPDNGPMIGMRGMSPVTFKDLIGCMLVGTAARFIGICLCAPMLSFFMPEHRRNTKWFGFFVVSVWLFQLPKATVQATLGGVAYTVHLIAGPQGLNKGLVMQQSSAITILLFASLGTVLVFQFGAPLALKASVMDTEAGWDNKKNRYLKTSKYYVAGPHDDVEEKEDADAVVELQESIEKQRVHEIEMTRPKMVTAAGFLVEDEATLHEPDNFFAMMGRVRAFTADRPHSAEPEAPRRRSMTQEVVYVLTGIDETEGEGEAGKEGGKEGGADDSSGGSHSKGHTASASGSAHTYARAAGDDDHLPEEPSRALATVHEADDLPSQV